MQLPLPPDASSLWLFAVVLAAWRITAFVCYEVGPFEMGTRLRRALAALTLARLVTCFHCVGVWVSLALTFALFEPHWRTLVLAIAVAGGVSVLERWLGGGVFGSTTEEG